MKTRIAILGLSVAVMAAVVATSSRAAGFDCSRAASVMEKTVCSDPSLSAKDDQLSSEYQAVRAGSMQLTGTAAPLVTEQNAWIAQAKNCDARTDCLSALYDLRITQLRDESDRIHSTDAPEQPSTTPPSAASEPTVVQASPANSTAINADASAKPSETPAPTETKPTIIGFLASGGVILLALILTPFAWIIADAVRKFAVPDTIFVRGGFYQLVWAKVFWRIGPQLFALGALWTLAIVLAGASLHIGAKASSGNSPSESSSAIPPVAPTQSATDSKAAQTDGNAGAVGNGASIPLTNSEAPVAPHPQPDAVKSPEAERPDPSTNSNLRDAIKASLNAGTSGVWHDELGGKGSISVSSPQTTGEKECRNFRYTAVTPDRSSTFDGSACRDGADADWVFAPPH